MALPNVTVNELTILLGNTIQGTDLLSFSDADGDPIEKFKITDNNGSTGSSNITVNGIVLPPFVTQEVLFDDLNTVILNSGTTIQANSYTFQAYANGQWGAEFSPLIYSVVQNVNKPIVVADDISVVQSESINLSNFITAFDPDGFPIKRWRIFDSNPGITSAKIIVDGLGELAAGQWHYLWPEQLQNAHFIAALAAPNNDPIFLRAFDRNDGQGSNGDGLWSDPVNINAFTAVNFNRPVGIPTEFNIATDETIAVTALFGWTDADGNSLKRARFFDTSIHEWSGNLAVNGVAVAGGSWVEFATPELASVTWESAERSFNEQVRFQVFDGNHWSDVQTFRVRTNEKPVIGVADDQSVRQQLEFVDISNLVVKLDDGPVYTRYEVFDENTSTLSGNFRLGATTLAPGQVHEISAQNFFDLNFKSGVYETRSSDDVYVRAFNGTFWSDWTRHNILTEPEYLDSLAAASWLNFRPQQNGTLPLTYSFMQIYPTYGGAIENEFVKPWAVMRNQVRQAFVRLEEVLNVDFEEVPDSVNTSFGQGGDIRIGTYCMAPDPPTAAYAFFPGPTETNGDIWLNRWFMGAAATQFTDAQDPPCGWPTEDTFPPGFGIPENAWDKGTPQYATFIHELGHAMGLKHPFEGLPVLPTATNSGFFTHMSYTGATHSEWGPELYDIAALQSIYGSNNSFASGNTVYNSSTWRGNFDVVDSIWDAGGIDTFDASDQIQGVTLDLRPGSFQQVATGNISIAFNTDIENAIGTQFGDSLTGNELVNNIVGGDGDDIIEGYGNSDLLSGGGGNDTYIYKMFDGHDTIDEDLGAGRDTIEIGLFLEMDDFAQDVRLTKQNFDMIIDFTIDDGISRGSITIEGQGFGRNRIETLDFLGTPVDLTFAFDSITSPGQQFAIDLGNPLQYGFAVTPVTA